MITVKKIESIDRLAGLKQQYLEYATAPLDGMWLGGFLPLSQHFGFFEQQQLVGYACINADGYLLQFHVVPEWQSCAGEVYSGLVKGEYAVVGKVNGAFVSTAEPQYLSLCLDHQASVEVHSLMYAQPATIQWDESGLLPMVEANDQQLDAFVHFANTTIGAPEQWLSGYYSNLIHRGELFGHWHEGKLLAAGECRVRDEYQAGYADLGMIVDINERGKGIATAVLKRMAFIANGKACKAICSTERTNPAAQTAIARAGLVAGHRILQLGF